MELEFHPSLVNRFICVYNDGQAAGVNKAGRPFKATKVDQIKFWNKQDKVIAFAEMYPELGVLSITSLVMREIKHDS